MGRVACPPKKQQKKTPLAFASNPPQHEGSPYSPKDLGQRARHWFVILSFMVISLLWREEKGAPWGRRKARDPEACDLTS
jgi:hypothetical protein